MTTISAIQASFYRPEVMTGIWVCIFISDWIMNYSGARFYYKYVKKFLNFEEGDNLRPVSEQEISDPLRLFARFISELLISTFGIWLLLYSCKLYSSWNFYQMICGLFILLEACAHFRHIGNVSLFISFRHGTGIKGSILLPRYVMLRAASVDYFLFGSAFLMVFLVNNVHFALGGAISCFLVAFFKAVMAMASRIEMIQNIEGRAS